MQSGDASPAGNAEVQEFMSVAAHDLRNPIAVVRASAQMAQRQIGRGDLDAARGRLAAIVEQTDRLTDMLETFVDAARIEARRLPLRLETCDLRELILAAADRARLVMPDQTERALELDVPEGLLGEWDRARLSRALRALLANAFVFGSAERPVRVRAARDGQVVGVRIDGGGAGPDDEESARLFERFFRGKSAAEAGVAGSGLGLFTARGIARFHGGDVRYIEGDTFELSLPLEH